MENRRCLYLDLFPDDVHIHSSLNFYIICKSDTEMWKNQPWKLKSRLLIPSSSWWLHFCRPDKMTESPKATQRLHWICQRMYRRRVCKHPIGLLWKQGMGQGGVWSNYDDECSVVKGWEGGGGLLSSYVHLAVLPSLSVSHVDVFFPVSTKPPLSCPVSVCRSLSINVCLCLLPYLPPLPPRPPLFFCLCLSSCRCHWLSLSPPSLKLDRTSTR